MVSPSHYWNSPFIDWQPVRPLGWQVYVFYMRESRVKARVPAVAEALCLWRPFRAVALLSGPLADQKGVFWLALEPAHAREAAAQLPRLGYSYAVDRLVPADAPPPTNATAVVGNPVRWRGETYRLERLYQEDRRQFRDLAPDRRTFIYEDETGVVRPIQGYRGDGSELSRRGLPVEDARLLANLVSPADVIDPGHRFLDPFGGVGGVLIEARNAGYTVTSADIDRRLRFGLAQISHHHLRADAAVLPIRAAALHALAGEPPYNPNTLPMLQAALAEFQRVLQPGARLALLAAAWQAEPLLANAQTLQLRLFLAAPINRKGTPVSVLAWEK
jgi:SAM-dependent methyltransferase